MCIRDRLEPWKRKRLVGSFEEKVKSALEKYSEEQNMKVDKLLAGKLSEVTDQGNEEDLSIKEPLEQRTVYETDRRETGRVEIAIAETTSAGIKSFGDIWERIKTFFVTLKGIKFRELDAPLVVNTLEFYLYSISLVSMTILISGVI